ncbi:MAG: hypothetical protein PHQ13_03460 [Rhodoferax sp.]|nr:hypothetical protein [Rhodoferax sp.]
MNTVTPLRPHKNMSSAQQTACSSQQPTPAQAVNTLWMRLDQARAVALCIPDKCETAWGADGAVAALAQVLALVGAVTQLLSQAQADTAQLEGLLP